ncbi:MAG: tyrosine-type recombinase/integrase [Marinobacter sp.]
MDPFFHPFSPDEASQGYGAKVLDMPLGEIGSVIRSKKPKRLPVVLSHDEAMGIIEKLKGPYRLLASLMYGSGLRVTEACRLRVKDIDFSNQVITVRDGQGFAGVQSPLG